MDEKKLDEGKFVTCIKEVSGVRNDIILGHTYVMGPRFPVVNAFYNICSSNLGADIMITPRTMKGYFRPATFEEERSFLRKSWGDA